MIDSRAEIHPSAKIDESVNIGPWTVIGPEVEIGKGTEVGPHVVISGYTTIGENNKIHQFSSLGDTPQDTTYANEETRLEIGNGNTIREYCMVSRGTAKGGHLTRIGDENFLMAYSHVGHDCIVGNQVTLTNYAALSGHVTVEDYVVIGGYSAIHQFCRVGAYSFVGRASYITKDVLPCVMIAGQTVASCGLNTVGLKRRGFTSEEIENLRQAYRIIFRKGLTVREALVELMVLANDCDKVKLLIQGLESSTRGIVR